LDWLITDTRQPIENIKHPAKVFAQSFNASNLASH
jgi:hypothetical protein